MRIVHIITRLIVGGAQENTILTCEWLHRAGHEVTLITGPTTGPEGSLVARARTGGYRTIECPVLLRRIAPLADWQALLDLRKLLRDLRPDVVHTHSSKAGVLGRMAARDTGCGCIVHTIHGMSFNRTQSAPVRRAYRAAERYCARFTHHFATVCDAMIDQSVSAGIAPREKFTTVYSGMEVDQFDPARHDRSATRRAWGVTDDEVVVATVARLFRNKGYEELIPAMAAALRQRPELRFVWIGDGAQRGEYEAELRRLGIRERVTLTGLVRPDEIPALLAGADLLAHASRWEGLPRAVVQAMLMEKPAISFDIDGAPEVVRPGETGLLVPLGDVAALGNTMASLAGDETARGRMGRRGRQYCLQRFDACLMGQSLERLYSALHSVR